MARIFWDGAEFGDTLFWTFVSNLYTTTSKYRSGARSYYMDNSGYGYRSITGIAELYIRFGYLVDNDTSDSGNRIIAFRNGTTTLGHVNLDASYHVNAYVNAVSVEDSGIVLTKNEWHLIEVHYKLDDAGVFQVKLDGIQIINYSGDTKPGAEATVDNIYVARNAAGMYWDDLALNDVNGGVDDSWVGDGHIEILTPVTGGTYQWTGSDGDSVDNYALVDDIPATGDDYVKDSTAGHQDIYSLSDFTGTGKIIQRVRAECRAKDNDATGGQIKIGMKSGGTTELSAALTLTGNYARYVGDDETLNPADSGAWEDADLDALQLVIECE